MLRFTASAVGESSGSSFSLWLTGAHLGRAAYVHPFPECLFRGGLFDAVRFSLSARRVKSSRKERRKETEGRTGKGGDSAVIERLEQLVAAALLESAPPAGGKSSVRVAAARALLQQVEREVEKRSSAAAQERATGLPRVGAKVGKIRF